MKKIWNNIINFFKVLFDIDQPRFDIEAASKELDERLINIQRECDNLNAKIILLNVILYEYENGNIEKVRELIKEMGEI